MVVGQARAPGSKLRGGDWIRRGVARAAPYVVVFVLALVSGHYFFTGGGNNQATRFDLVRAVLDLGTVRIDAYHDDTVDRARFRDHYYCDKAPGVSLTALPFVAATRALEPKHLESPDLPLLIQIRVATFFCATLPTAWAAALVFFVSRRLGHSRGASAVGAVAYGVGSPAWVYGTFFWGTGLAAGCLMSAFALMVGFERPSKRAAWTLGAAEGLLVGWATLTEFPCVGAAAILLAAAAWRARSSRVLGRWLAGVVVGGIVPAIVLGLYNRAAFGTPFHLGYSDVVGFDGMNEGLFGITYPKRDVLYWLLFSTRKGLFVLSPVLAGGAAGMVVLLADRRRRLAGVVATAIFVYWLLVNASYRYWGGGWSYGPRHLGPALPFLCLGLPALWQGSRFARWTLAPALVVSVAFTLLGVATHPLTPDGYLWPLRDIFWPSFVRGRLSLNDEPYFFHEQATHSFNIGQRLGLHGPWSLVPLLVVWGLLALLWVWNERRARKV